MSAGNGGGGGGGGGGESTAALRAAVAEVEAHSVAAGVVDVAAQVDILLRIAADGGNPNEPETRAGKGKGGGGGGGGGDLSRLDPQSRAAANYDEMGWKGGARKAVAAAVVRVVRKGDGQKGAGAAAAVVRCVNHTCGGDKGT